MFTASKIFWFMASPGNLLALLLLAGGLLWLAGLRRAGTLLLGLHCALLLAVFLLPLDYLAAKPLEDRFARPDTLPGHVDGILVLGGYQRPYLAGVRHWPELNEHADRLVAFVDLARRYPKAVLVASGGSGSLLHQEAKESEVTKAVLSKLGFPPDRVVFESRSRNTLENARFSKELVNPRPGQTWVLVTTAMHMPRSVACFRSVGWRVVPFAVDFSTLPTFTYGLPNLTSKLHRLEYAVHEWIGLAAYRLLGHTHELWPKPHTP